MKQEADVGFACAGGYPKDVSLYQGSKCYDPADVAVKDGGIIIAIIPVTVLVMVTAGKTTQALTSRKKNKEAAANDGIAE